MVRIITRVAGWARVRRLAAGGFDPIEDGHPGIHHHRVGPQPPLAASPTAVSGSFSKILRSPTRAGTTFEPP